jgi:hypothetical protein
MHTTTCAPRPISASRRLTRAALLIAAFAVTACEPGPTGLEDDPCVIPRRDETSLTGVVEVIRRPGLGSPSVLHPPPTDNCTIVLDRPVLGPVDSVTPRPIPSGVRSSDH